MLQVEKWFNNSLDNLQDLLLEKEKDWDQYFRASHEINEKRNTIRYLNVNEAKRANISFGLLKDNFQAGLLLKKKGDVWQIHEQFCHGEMEEACDYDLKIPECRTNQVLRTKASSFQKIAALNLPYFSEEASALLFKPCEDYAFLLFSEFPEVILKYLSDEVHDFLLKAFTYS